MEDSRTAAVGRKRKLRSDGLADGKHLDLNLDIDDYKRWKGEASDSKESGEVSTSADATSTSTSRRASDASADSLADSLQQTRSKRHVAVASRVSSITGDEDDHDEPRPTKGQEMKLHHIKEGALRKHVQQMTKSNKMSVETAVRQLIHPMKPHRKAAKAFIHIWDNAERPTRTQPARRASAASAASDGNAAIRNLRGQAAKAEVVEIDDEDEDEAESTDEENVPAQAEIEGADAYDYGTLARSAAAESNNTKANAPPMLCLANLSEDEQMLQGKYFNITDLRSTVYCLSCGNEGHNSSDCPERTCKHCGALDEHYSGACPTHKKCSRCRQRGHDTRTCKNHSVQGGTVSDPCDICGNTGHIEEECTGLWRTFSIPPDVPKRLADEVVVSCYNCASDDHFGDDCPSLPYFIIARTGKGTWSQKNVSRYIHDDDVADEDMVSGVKQPHAQAYQLAQFDDMRD